MRTVPLVSTLNSCSASGKGIGRFVVVVRIVVIARRPERKSLPWSNPPATEMAGDAGHVLLLGFARVCTAAPASTISSVTLRPLSGSSRMRSFSMT